MLSSFFGIRLRISSFFIPTLRRILYVSSETVSRLAAPVAEAADDGIRVIVDNVTGLGDANGTLLGVVLGSVTCGGGGLMTVEL